MLPIQNKLLNKKFNKNNSRNIKYIVIHYTAGVSSKNGSALNTVNGFNNSPYSASAHYVVDDFNIIQCVEDKNTSWHCGTSGKYKHKNCRNYNSIGIEICSNHDNFINYDINTCYDRGWYFTEASLKNASDLTKYLMKKYNIPLENVIMHYDVTGKICPAPFINNGGWTEFKNSLIEKKEEEKMYFNNITEIPQWARTEIEYFIDNGYLKGKDDNKLMLTEEMIRLLVILYRVLHKGG